MGNETDGGQVLIPRRGRNPGIDIAVLVHEGIVDAKAVEPSTRRLAMSNSLLGTGGAALP